MSAFCHHDLFVSVIAVTHLRDGALHLISWDSRFVSGSPACVMGITVSDAHTSYTKNRVTNISEKALFRRS
jgi:hypothetical protein